MPWTYSRWVRAFAVVRDAMPADRRARWERALALGYTGIAAELRASPVSQNIPAHHAMGLYVAGQALQRPAWSEQASAFLVRVAEAQDPGGFWSEHVGPVVNYNFVYVDALGTYYALSRDERVAPALARAARFHAHFTYPDGSYVETVDERNPYDLNWFKLPNAGFTATPDGRGFTKVQLARKRAGRQPVDADLAASFVLYGQAGEASPSAAERRDARFILGDGNGDALIRRDGPWFACMSAYTAPLAPSRWIQDRQNFLSLYHDQTGLILGGGNTKLQPRWSTFTVGDVSLLARRPGDANPNFLPPPGLLHTPTRAKLSPAALSLELTYGSDDATVCHVSVTFPTTKASKMTYEIRRTTGDRPIRAHAPLLPRMNSDWRTESGKTGTIDETPLNLAPGEAGAWFEHNGWRVTLPPNASIAWPVIPHQPYAPDGQAGAGEGRIVIVLPFTGDIRRQELLVEVSSP